MSTGNKWKVGFPLSSVGPEVFLQPQVSTTDLRHFGAGFTL